GNSDFAEDWNVDGLISETRQYFPTETTKEQITALSDANEVYEHLAGEAIAFYEERESSMPAPEAGEPGDTMRALEREVMLQLIDQKWREHLSEMDYLREGINLRAMGQKDPLVEWQRDGFEMFGQMMAGIDDDYVKIVMHAQVQVLEQAQPEQTSLAGAQYEAAEDPVQGTGAMWQAARTGPAPGEEVVFAAEPSAPSNGPAAGAPMQQNAPDAAPEIERPVVKDSEFERAGRNDPCPCGSGKKFKFCHGR
ncbi:MAG TPA: SEC-C metal-binding domain-containing protein, partial [Acidimicrobiales bacterium]|nr:SEC-C metal-binding domain-containing protein [Acidimicrobiales bacterium]